MSKIKKISAIQILDYRGKPTIEAEVVLDNGIFGRASVPSGASTGSNEAIELRDGGAKFMGKGVLRAVNNVNTKIAKALIGLNVWEQYKIDQIMIELDETENKSDLGANAILAVSLAICKAAAENEIAPLYNYVSSFSIFKSEFILPTPMVNIINGGAHAKNSTDIQEFMIMPIGAKSFSEGLRWVVEIFHNLKKVLDDKGFSTTVGDEGGFPLSFDKTKDSANAFALDLLSEAVEKSGYKLGSDIVFALDIAASELFKNDKYNLKTENKVFTSDEMIDWLEKLTNKYPIVSIEDGLSESDWDGWIKLTEKLGKKIQLIGDDLLVTNVKFLAKAIKEKACTGILVKVNQIGTLSEAIEAVDMAKKNGFNTIMSHRSGETEDTTIADLAVGLATLQIKTGSVSRTDRVAKYNQLLRIERELGKNAKYAGANFLK